MFSHCRTDRVGVRNFIKKDVVRRILSAHYQPSAGGAGPSSLTFIGHMKDSLHSIDLFQCESIALRTYWVLVVMDQYTRRIVGFGIQALIVDGVALSRMFNRAVRGQATPKYLSSDHDPRIDFISGMPIFEFSASRKSKQYLMPLSHPFVERLIGTIRREYLDQMLFWTAVDLESKLSEFMDYYNRHRTHARSRRQNTGRSSWRQCVPDVEVISMERTLSRIISDAHGSIITNSPCTGSRFRI